MRTRKTVLRSVLLRAVNVVVMRVLLTLTNDERTLRRVTEAVGVHGQYGCEPRCGLDA